MPERSPPAMGRPEPSVLFAQTFSHPQLDEYVDEVLFSEPVVITACEFLEQNASSACQLVPIAGATSPPSFALEVFVQCESEARFRRLCQPFLYSHSSSNVLEVEGVVTNHLVVRGSYRGLSLVIYGNTAEDLGQFNIEFDDSSLTNIVTSVKGNLEDLPLPLRTSTSADKELERALSVLTLPLPSLDISAEVKQLLGLVFRFLDKPESGDAVHKAVNILQSVAASFIAKDLCGAVVNQKPLTMVKSTDCKELLPLISDSISELRRLHEDLHELAAEKAFLEFDDELASSRRLVDFFGEYFHLESQSTCHPSISRNKNVILKLSSALLLCSGKESCFHFVNGGGIEDLRQVFLGDLRDSATVLLLLLGVMEQTTRYSIGCEGILGWWPREGDVPLGISECYTQLLKLLLQKPRHDIASLATRVLHRLRFYEVLSRYECAVLSVLRDISSVDRVSDGTFKALNNARSQIKTLVKLVNLRGPIDDPSPVVRGSRAIHGQGEGCLSYKAIGSLISSSYHSPFTWDNDPYLLVLLKERGFFPLSAALLSSSMLRSTAGGLMHFLAEIVSVVWTIILSMLFSRSGLIFLAQQSDICSTMIPILRSADSPLKDECLPLHYAFVLLSKGFFCGPQEIGTILEMHLRVVRAVDQMLSLNLQSEEFLWVLWELCALSRVDCGRQAVLAFEYFPEVISALIRALHLVKESESITNIGGASPLDVAIFHSVAEIFEIIVSHPTASSLGSWIGHVVELHNALNSSSPGSNRKDAPTRLLEWIDAGVVYQKHGTVGLLRYAAVIAAGGDAHLMSASILDVMDVEHGIGECSGSSDVNLIENLGKIILEKTFDGVTLRDSSVVQLTTAFRILAFISEDSTVAVALYDEGAVTIIYAILVNCRFMLERSSNNYDYLVDDGTECNSTSDALMERNREQSLIDLLFPSLVLLINLLRKLQEANEQHRNTKLVNALVRLHRELSPKLAACLSDLSYLYPDSALRYEGVCHLTASALAFWPVYGWTPGLFHSLLTSVQVSSQLALGPRETCSFMCLLNDLCPEEDIWKWKNGIPLFSVLRSLAVKTILGPKKEEEVNWYLKSEHVEEVLNQLKPQLDKVAQMIQHYVISGLVVIQDMLRVFLVRIAFLKVETASLLLKPILSSLLDYISNVSFSSDTDNYKVFRYLNFIVSLLEHPQAKALLLKEGIVHILQKVMYKCLRAVDPERKHTLDGRGTDGDGFAIYNWCLPILKALSLLCNSKTSAKASEQHKLDNLGSTSAEDRALVMLYLLEFLKVLPLGQELLTCTRAFKDFSCHKEGRSSLIAAFIASSTNSLFEHENGDHTNQIASAWRKFPPLLCCWRKFWGLLDSMDDFSALSVDGISMLSSASLSFCLDGKSVDMKAVAAVKFLFGLSEENKEDVTFEETFQFFKAISSTATDTGPSSFSRMSESAKLLALLLLSPDNVDSTVNQIFHETVNSSWIKDSPASEILSMATVWDDRHSDILRFVGLQDKFVWECPETLPDKSSLSLKRKMTTLDASGRCGRGDNAPNDHMVSTVFSRGLGPSAPSSGPTRRDNFRLRKPNTSRSPSMHVDDYVARERNIDGGSDVIAVPRVGSTSGRPPSIHVDEFMARQRERQSSASTIVGEAVAQVKNIPPPSEANTEKVKRPKQLKTDLDDELQGIDIVFDGEESEPDDKLPFPQHDDNLKLSNQVGQSPPHSIVEETESDAHESGQFSRMSTPMASNADDNAQSEFSSRMSASLLERPLTREPSVTSEKKFFDPSNEQRDRISSSLEATSSWISPHRSYSKHGMQESHDHKCFQNQPPLPPMPPPMISSQAPDFIPHQKSAFPERMMESSIAIPTSFQAQSEYLSALNKSSLNQSMRPLPPLPLNPPPFVSYPYNAQSLKASTPQSSVYGQTSIGATDFPQAPLVPSTGVRPASYPQPPLAPPMVFNQPVSVQGTLYGNPPMQPFGDNNAPNAIPSLPFSQSIIQPMQTISRLLPLQPPLHVPQSPQPPRPSALSSQQSDHQGLSLQSLTQLQMHSLQSVQQSQQVSPMHLGYMKPQQQVLSSSPCQPHHEAEPAQPPQVLHQQAESANQQKDLGISLYDYFKSPESIQALLSDREKLCQLLEQHPKLMQMLQERLGQL